VALVTFWQNDTCSACPALASGWLLVRRRSYRSSSQQCIRRGLPQKPCQSLLWQTPVLDISRCTPRSRCKVLSKQWETRGFARGDDLPTGRNPAGSEACHSGVGGRNANTPVSGLPKKTRGRFLVRSFAYERQRSTIPATTEHAAERHQGRAVRKVH